MVVHGPEFIQVKTESLLLESDDCIQETILHTWISTNEYKLCFCFTTEFQLLLLLHSTKVCVWARRDTAQSEFPSIATAPSAINTFRSGLRTLLYIGRPCGFLLGLPFMLLGLILSVVGIIVWTVGWGFLPCVHEWLPCFVLILHLCNMAKEDTCTPILKMSTNFLPFFIFMCAFTSASTEQENMRK